MARDRDDIPGPGEADRPRDARPSDDRTVDDRTVDDARDIVAREGGDGRRDDLRYDGAAGDVVREQRSRRNPLEPPGAGADEPRARQIEPNRVEVERRAGDERRLRDEPVAEDRRVADRRAALEEQRARERDASRERRAYVVARVMMGVDYLFALLYALLGVRFVLSLLGASETAGFVQFINGMTQPFYAPFAGIVARPAVNGGFLDFPILIALLAYALLHMAVRGLLKLMISPRT
ncbi:MAG TPA: YggT family protein [Longimicrobiales bacterium]|nr:YggT family protein [Longimicrobiales bacterium]